MQLMCKKAKTALKPSFCLLNHWAASGASSTPASLHPDVLLCLAEMLHGCQRMELMIRRVKSTVMGLAGN